MEIVLVEWFDSNFVTSGWHSKQLEMEREHCVTIGVKTLEDKDFIVITPSITPHSFAQDIAIPKGCIKRIRQLRVNDG